MQRHVLTLALAAFVIGFGLGGVHASSNRLYVSITGSDAANCQAGTPCRTFARAIANSGTLTPANLQ
jgi:hypothetical protein